MAVLELVHVLGVFVAVLDLGCVLEGLVYAPEGLVVMGGQVCALEDFGQEGLVDWEDLGLAPGL